MTTKTELLKVIRHQCVTCCNGSLSEVDRCKGGKKANEFTTCYLHPFRFGTDPFNEVSEAKKEASKRRAAHMNRTKERNVQDGVFVIVQHVGM